VTEQATLPEGVRELKERLEFNPGDVETREQLGEQLLELGSFRSGLAHLCVAAEIRAEREDFAAAIGLLNRVLDLDPDHAKARLMLPRFYAKVPRRPTENLKAPSSSTGESLAVGGDDDAEYGAEFFTLPVESAAALAQLLPFIEEDSPLEPGVAHVALPYAEERARSGLFASLDRELRRASRIGIEIPPPPQPDPFENFDDDFDTAPFDAVQVTRIKPASSIVSFDELPPNRVIGLLDSEPANELLERIDAINLVSGQGLLGYARSASPALYVVVRGEIELLRELGGEKRGVDLLGPGDFFGESGLLTLGAPDADAMARTDALLIELPARAVDEIADLRPEVRDLLWDTYFTRSFHSMMATSPIFGSLDLESLTRISVELEPLAFQCGDIVLCDTEPPAGLYCVVGGNLSVVDIDAEPSTIIERLLPGDFFGSVRGEVVSQRPAMVVATEGTTVLWLPLSSVTSLVAAIPPFARALAAVTPSQRWPYHLVPAASDG